jgi:predicted DNA binding CopG/RHH family protein
MKKEIKHNKLMNIRMSETLIEEYKNYCEDNGLVISTRIRFLIQKDIEGKIKIEK